MAEVGQLGGGDTGGTNTLSNWRDDEMADKLIRGTVDMNGPDGL
jgi:hypothetical protein